MATTLYFRDAVSEYSTGNNDNNLAGTSSGWAPRQLSTSRGSTATSIVTDTVAGTTNGIETKPTGGSGVPRVWYTPPLDADVTISGSVTWNLRAAESNMNANVAINGRLEKVDGATGVITLIDQTARTTELAVTTEGANNFAETPGAGVACKRGDRLRVRVFGDDAGTMATGYTFTFWFDGPTAAASGDSYFTLTENLTFVSAPAGSQVFLTNTGLSLFTPADSGWLAYGSAVDVGTDWSNYAANFATSDDAYGTATVPAASSVSYVELTDYTTGASGSILGVAVEVEWKSANSAVTLECILLNSSGIPTGTAKYTTGGSATDRTDTLGGSFDNWGAELTLSTVTSTGFGVAVKAHNSGGSSYLVSVDRVRLKVYYDATHERGSQLEAWTSRGAGVQSVPTSSGSSWTAPVRWRNSSGVYVDWYTKILSAVTLGGAATCNIRAKESNAGMDAVVRVEVAVVDADGANAVVWAAGTYSTEFSTSETANNFYISGDDYSVAAGKRIRIRVSMDNVPDVAMSGGHIGTLYYAGTSGGASGDSYVTFTQTLVEGGTYFTPTPATVTLTVPAPSGIGGTLALTPAAVATTVAVPAPTFQSVYTISPTPAVATLTVTAPTIGQIYTISPGPVAAVMAVPAPSLATSVSLAPAPVAATVSVPASSLSLVYTLSPGAVPVVLTVPAPTLDVATGATYFTPSPVAALLGIPVPSFSTSISFEPAPVGATTAVPSPTIQSVYTFSPAPVTAASAVPSPSISTSLGLSPTPVAAVLSVPGSSLSTSLALTPGAVPVTLSVPSPSLQSVYTFSPAPIPATLAVPSSFLQSIYTLSPNPVVAILTVPASIIENPGITLTPAPVAATLTVPSLGLSTSVSLTPAPVGATLTVPASGLSTVTSFAPNPVATALVVPSPSLGLSLNLAPNAIPVILTVTASALPMNLSPDPVVLRLTVPSSLVYITAGDVLNLFSPFQKRYRYPWYRTPKRTR